MVWTLLAQEGMSGRRSFRRIVSCAGGKIYIEFEGQLKFVAAQMNIDDFMNLLRYHSVQGVACQSPKPTFAFKLMTRPDIREMFVHSEFHIYPHFIAFRIIKIILDVHLLDVRF